MCIVIDGKPKSTLIFFLLDKTPHFVEFSSIDLFPENYICFYRTYTHTAYVISISLIYCTKVSTTFCLGALRTLEVSRKSKALVVISIICSSMLGLHPFLLLHGYFFVFVGVFPFLDMSVSPHLGNLTYICTTILSTFIF